jgi:hypothetical protein
MTRKVAIKPMLKNPVRRQQGCAAIVNSQCCNCENLAANVRQAEPQAADELTRASFSSMPHRPCLEASTLPMEKRPGIALALGEQMGTWVKRRPVGRVTAGFLLLAAAPVMAAASPAGQISSFRLKHARSASCGMQPRSHCAGAGARHGGEG